METRKSKVSTVDEYIHSLTDDIKPILQKLRETIKKAAPKSEEFISYQIPAYKFHGMIAWFRASKNHYGLYPYAETIDAFKDKLKAYELSKGTIKFPYDKSVPVKLITEIIKYKVNSNFEKEELKKLSRNKKK
jgi:uncharacterized protein YdhG (YjbR/CyaY superfamily)